MTHSFLVVGGTKNKRKLEAISGLSGLPARNVRVRSLINLQKSRGSLSEARQTRKPPNFDTTILQPEEDKQAISIDQIRRLQHQLSLKPYAAESKTGVILEAQRMTVEAQNALLKTLEEPPAHSVLILTAPSTRSLLPTIVSRCQITRLPPAIDIDLESEEYKKGVEEFLKLLRKSRGERLAWVEENKKIFTSQSDSGRSMLNLLDIWISVLRDLLLIETDNYSFILSSIKESNNKTISRRFAPSDPPTADLKQFSHLTINNSDLIRGLELTIKIKKLIASTNVSPRLAVEVLLLDLPVLTPKHTS